MWYASVCIRLCECLCLLVNKFWIKTFLGILHSKQIKAHTDSAPYALHSFHSASFPSPLFLLKLWHAQRKERKSKEKSFTNCASVKRSWRRRRRCCCSWNSYGISHGIQTHTDFLPTRCKPFQWQKSCIVSPKENNNKHKKSRGDYSSTRHVNEFKALEFNAKCNNNCC